MVAKEERGTGGAGSLGLGRLLAKKSEIDFVCFLDCSVCCVGGGAAGWLLVLVGVCIDEDTRNELSGSLTAFRFFFRLFCLAVVASVLLSDSLSLSTTYIAVT